MQSNYRLRPIDQFPGPNRYMDCPPEWNSSDEPEDKEPDPVQVAEDAAECAAYEAACDQGTVADYYRSRLARPCSPELTSTILAMSRLCGWDLHKSGEK